MGEVTRLIGAAREGDRGAFDRISELLYPELRKARMLLALALRQ